MTALFRQSAGDVQRPQAAKPPRLVLVFEGNLRQRVVCRGVELLVRGPLLQQPLGVPHEPLVLVQQQLDQFLIALLRQIHRHRLGAAIADLVDAAIAAIPDVADRRDGTLACRTSRAGRRCRPGRNAD